jgi:hypothetical protein
MKITFIRKSGRDYAIRCQCDDGMVLAVRTYDRPLGLPHDLAHYIVERELELPWGFWGLVAAGAPFKSVEMREGRKRPRHRAKGQWLIKQHHDDLTEAEALVGVLLHAWRDGAGAEGAYRAALARCWRRTNAAPDRDHIVRVYTALSQMEAQWRNLGWGQALTVDWPTTHGQKHQRVYPTHHRCAPRLRQGRGRKIRGRRGIRCINIPRPGSQGRV